MRFLIKFKAPVHFNLSHSPPPHFPGLLVPEAFFAPYYFLQHIVYSFSYCFSYPLPSHSISPSNLPFFSQLLSFSSHQNYKIKNILFGILPQGQKIYPAKLQYKNAVAWNKGKTKEALCCVKIFCILCSATAVHIRVVAGTHQGCLDSLLIVKK